MAGNRALDKIQFPGLFSHVFFGSATYDAPSLLDAAGTTTTITVTGVQLGDMVIGLSHSVDLAGITVTAYVSAADTVSVRFQNESGGTLDLASATLRVAVARPNIDLRSL